jgi:autotransporter passenger strand-loop-strand repeat protein
VNYEGVIELSGGATANNVVVNGGSIVLQTGLDTLSGLVTFDGPGEIIRDAVGLQGTGITGAILNFGAGDMIDDTFMGAGTQLTSSYANGNTNVTLTSGTGQNMVSDEFSFAGNFTGKTFLATFAAGSGTELTVSATANTTVISSGQSTPPNYVVAGGYTLDVLPGGTANGVTIQNGGSANFGGTDTGTVIDGGGNATVTGSETGATVMANDGETIANSGTALDDQIYGDQTVSNGGTVTGETVFNGGVLTVLAGGSAMSTTISAGGSASFGGTDGGTVISGGSATVTGIQTNATVLAAGSETVSGTATGDQIYGVQIVSAATAIVNNETVFNGGMLDLFLAGVTANNTVLNTGATLNISGKATANDTVIQGGTIVLESPKATLENGVTFAGSGAIIVTSLTNTTSTGIGELAVISGFAGNDVIKVTSSLIGTNANLKFTPVNGGTETSVTISGGSGSETFIFNGAVTSANFTSVTTSVTSGVTYDVFEPACFCAGTNIRTPNGDAPVETLKIGDMVMTAAGQAVPVRWIGISTVSTRFADPLRVMPVRIRAGALAENMPERDLLVSPDHAMFLGGILLQAGALVNGNSITREARMPEIFTYYHVEVANHELILAEGAPTETFVDNVDRMAFDNWAEHQALYGGEAEIVEMPYPRARSARQLPMAMRRLLAARAAAICGTALAS